ncbi:MAG: pyridoxal 5'-phosphate synthase glutaminase subunit PdxT [Anaerolineaceae bacterium]|jgi:5'-phosphate synthase pdxT subunit|nr:pyridoxal 5'-phosphate synthase glutaminase subunit PdxT [Anaerolineaceae bacterium]MDD4042552.1 pyridoxal 5'-phosphate synthase glutaminase subunit PdxT [Anaerolineaceae bacterium]MDD4578563.1 pyridoxal 5'-phosphate synthase glutaminase subunit PdxT [Anaerolineaceae bacterium]
MKIGVLALQGDFREHRISLEKLGADVSEVRLPEHLDGLSGLIIPGGESTAIGKLMVAYGLLEAIQAFGKTKAIWGTCAGAILLSKNTGSKQPLLELMDITVQRNAFGRQVDSFEIDLPVLFLNPSAPDYHLTFIRGPIITEVYGRAQPLLSLPDGRIIAAQQGKLLATSFHPELTGDLRFHRYFLELALSESVN